MKVVDMHCDTISGAFACQRARGKHGIHAGESSPDRSEQDAEREIIFCRIFARCLCISDERQQTRFTTAMKLVDLFYNGAGTVFRPHRHRKDAGKEIEENRKAGRMSALLTLEEGGDLPRGSVLPAGFLPPGGRG